MSLSGIPIALDDLLQGHSIEWERLEFKAGWNPLEVLHTICAFANDFNNLGGGYLILGIEQDKDGRPKLPPSGIPIEKVDGIQKGLLELGFSAIQPAYHPLTHPTQVTGKTILVIWAPGGQSRPYRAMKSLSKTSKEWKYYIRKQSSTIVARGNDERELLGLVANVPFDDRMNSTSKIQDLSLSLMIDFLGEVGSEMADHAVHAPLEIVGRQMNIIDGPSEFPLPKNVGLMFFHEHPQKFFPQTQIDVVWFPEGSGGDRIEEKSFTGPLARMTREALSYIERNYLKQTIIKRPNRAEADRVWNFPYPAVEEALVNAVYHRSYEIREPIEVRITPEELLVLSFPGPDRSIRMKDLQAGKAVSRRYRNRRIGEFLKELNLAEGRCTGIPKIIRATKENGSAPPIFETDDEHTYFLVRLSANPETLGTEKNTSLPTVTDIEFLILKACADKPKGTSEILSMLGYQSRTGSYKKAINNLIENIKALEYTIPDTPRSKHQKYYCTDRGHAIIRTNRRK